MNTSLFFILFSLFSSSSLWVTWVLMEIMNFMFIPYMACKWENSQIKVFFYYIIQSVASMTLIIFVQLIWTNKIFMVLVSLSLLFKLGMYPFYSWVISVSEMVSWEFVIIVFTLMKGAPFMMMNMLSMFLSVIWLSILSMLVSLGGIYSNSVRKMMAFSSIDHTSWMVVALILSKWVFMCYYFVYLTIMFVMMKVMKLYNMFSLKVLTLSKSSSILLFVIILSVSSIPPFCMFFPKLNVVSMMINDNLFIEVIVSLVLNLFSMYIYIKFMIMCLMTKSEKSPFFIFGQKSQYNLVVLMSTTMSILMMIILQ